MNHESITISWATEFVGRHAAIRVNGRSIPFPPARYETMAILIGARLTSDSGVVRIAESDDKPETDRACQCVRRVRLDIDAVVGPGIGEKLIESTGKGTYRLTITRGDIRINENIRELAPTHLAKDLVDRILANYKEFRVLLDTEVPRPHFPSAGTDHTTTLRQP